MAESYCSLDFAVSSFDFEQIIVVYFISIRSLSTTQFSLFIILSQISGASSKSKYGKLEFCVTSFWFDYDQHWWSSCKGGSSTAATSKVELFVIIVNDWKPLTFITKISTLDVAAVLDPPLSWHAMLALFLLYVFLV